MCFGFEGFGFRKMDRLMSVVVALWLPELRRVHKAEAPLSANMYISESRFGPKIHAAQTQKEPCVLGLASSPDEAPVKSQGVRYRTVPRVVCG